MSEFAIAPATTTTTAVIDGTEDLTRELAALDAIPSLNLVSMPALATLCGTPYNEAVAAIASYCASRRAFFIVDPPSDWTSVAAAASGVGEVASIVQENGAIYWPPLKSGAASGAVTDVYVATDTTRGVWTAPAGIEAALPGVEPASALTDADNALLNPLGVNCIRSFPVYGTVLWGARTLSGVSDWRYVSVRRFALFLESSIIDSLTWTASEPNATPLWTAVRASVENFLTGYWRDGALIGATPNDAFFVRCDATTTTQDDLDNGRLNVDIGFAAVRPAEFVLLRIGLWARKPADDD
jgi:phage tail sheath protein FI